MTQRVSHLKKADTGEDYKQKFEDSEKYAKSLNNELRATARIVEELQENLNDAVKEMEVWRRDHDTLFIENKKIKQSLDYSNSVIIERDKIIRAVKDAVGTNCQVNDYTPFITPDFPKGVNPYTAVSIGLNNPYSGYNVAK